MFFEKIDFFYPHIGLPTHSSLLVVVAESAISTVLPFPGQSLRLAISDVYDWLEHFLLIWGFQPYSSLGDVTRFFSD